MKRVFFVSVALIVLSFFGYTQQQGGNTYTLKQCVDTAIANNLVVNQNGLDMQASQIRRKQARLNMLPDLSGSAGHGINQGRSIDPFTNGYINQQVNYANYSLNGGIVLFNGLAMQNTAKQNSLEYEASKMDWQQAKDNVTINIILAYLRVLGNNDQLIQLQARADLTAKQAERLESQVNEGAIRPSDMYDIKGQLANDKLAVIDLQNGVETAKLALCELMNIPYDKEMKLEKIDPEPLIASYAQGPDEIYETALHQFAQVRSAELRTRSFQSALKAARGRLFPLLTLNGSVNSNYSSAATQNVLLNSADVPTTDYVLIGGTPSAVFRKQSNFRTDKISYSKQLNNNIFSSISLNLSIPIFNSLQQRNNIKLAKLDVKNYSMIEHSVKTVLQQDIERAHINMATAFDRYKTLLDQVNSYKESFRAAEIRFNEGVGNSIDYLTAKNNLDRANSNLIISRYDYVLKTKILDYYQGKTAW